MGCFSKWSVALILLISSSVFAHPGGKQASAEVYVISQNPHDAEELIACPAQRGIVTGKKMQLGQGHVQSYVIIGRNGKPESLGVMLSENALQGLPLDYLYLEYEIDLPCHVPPYNHIGFDWNRQGHPPEAIYGVPHFDIHFYMISKAERHAITCAASDTKCNLGPNDPKTIPAGYVSTMLGTERMGMHWVDPTSAELNGSPFTKTFIYGFYDGKLAFLEPMTTVNFLKSNPNSTSKVKQPLLYPYAGYYPKAYTVRHLARTKRYTISLENLTGVFEQID